MNGPIGGSSPEDLMTQLAARMNEQQKHAEELGERLAGMTGRAQSEDGLLRVVCTATDPAHELHIDPRAMRLPADELSELLAGLVRAARDDLQRQTSETLRELSGEDGPEALIHNPAAAQAKLAQLNDLVSGPIRESTEMLERLRRQLKI